MSKVEILSPAGTKESLIAAVRAGADAVYLGGSKFSARAYAGNFTEETLQEYLDYCHLRDVKVYVAVNTLIQDSEVDSFMEYVSKLYEMGADALILQDMGMIDLIGRQFPMMELHASTQMTTNTAEDVLFLKEQGISRVVVSRELSAGEIRTIKEETGLEIEVFVHGALCLCYSGKCYFSSMNGGRSGNRGACAQPCREEYQSSVEGIGAYFLSPKDLRTIEGIEAVCQSGVDSLKIEGRMKRPEYVYLVTKNYKQALSERSSEQLKELALQLEKVFNRSFTEGYLLGKYGEAIINTKFQKPQGTKAAKVISYDKKTKRLKLKLLDDLVKGDGLTTGERVGRILKGKTVVQAAKSGEVIELDYMHDIPSGTVIYKTYDHQMMSSIEEGMRQEKRVPIRMRAMLRSGEYAVLCGHFVRQESGKEIIERRQLSEERIEKAEKAALTQEKIREQFAKVGDYPFVVESIDLEMDEGIYLSVKSLNKLRRDLLEQMAQVKIASSRREKKAVEAVGISDKEKIFKSSSELIDKDSVTLSVRVRNKEQAEAVCRFGKETIRRLYVDSKTLYHQLREEYPLKEIVFCLPSVLRQDDMESAKAMMEDVEIFLTGSMGVLHKYRDRKGIADYSLNAYNSFTHNFYHRQGIETTLSIETLYAEGEYPVAIEDKSMVEVPIYLYPRLMTTEYCPHKASDGRCKETVCQLPKISIISRKGERFVFYRELGCKVLIFSDRPKRLEIPRIKRLIEERYRHFRIELMDETGSEIEKIIKDFIQYQR